MSRQSNTPFSSNLGTRDECVLAFKNCPICNGLVRNSDDLAIHLGEAHALDDMSVHTIVKEVETETVVASGDDDTDGQPTMPKTDDESDDIDKPLVSYTQEVKLICNILNLEYKKDVKFIELKLLYGE